MAAFPDLKYTEGYSYEYAPQVVRTPYATQNSRQRVLVGTPNDLVSVKLRLDNAELATLETFILDTINNGADEFDGPYYVSDAVKTGTLQIVDGEYSTGYLADDYWEVSYSFEVKNRDLTDEQNLYEVVNENGGFVGLVAIFDALENMVNNNELIA